jgi:integrase
MSTKPKRDLPDLVLFLAATGLRIGEPLIVKRADVSLDEGSGRGLSWHRPN